MIFETRVNRIPCQCKVTHYRPPEPMRVYGPGMADADPPIDAEFEFIILDRKGRPAPWLEKYVGPDDNQRLLEEFHLEVKAEDYDDRCF